MGGEIFLYTGEVVLVDEEDLPLVSSYRWHLSEGYAARSFKEGTGKLHQLLLPSIPGLEVDHINRKKLDNRRENLRYNTRRGNNLNKEYYRADKVALIGVGWNQDKGKWDARMRIPGKIEFLGRYNTMEEATEVARLRREELIQVEVQLAQYIVDSLKLV